MNYKILACDLDGTLLDDCGRISEKNRAAIKAIAEGGGYFVPSTGRSFSEIPGELRESPYVRYAICSGGASVIDTEDMKGYGFYIEPTIAGAALEIARSYRCHPTLRASGKCYVEGRLKNPEAYKLYNVCEPHIRVLEDYAEEVEDIGSLCKGEVEMLSLFFCDDGERAACGERLRSLGLRVIDSWEHNLEVFSMEAGKGNALIRLAGLLSVPREGTAAMGDSLNDLTMIEDAGLGIAVANACPELKAAAKVTVCSNSEDAVYHVMKSYFSPGDTGDSR